MILDVAIWRRFEEALRFEPPNLEQLRRLLSLKLRGVRREFDPEDSQITGLFKGMSHADVERVLRRAIKAMVLSAQEFLANRHLERTRCVANGHVTRSGERRFCPKLILI